MAMALGVIAGKLDWAEIAPQEGAILALMDASAASGAVPIGARWAWVARRAQDAEVHGNRACVVVEEDIDDSSDAALVWNEGTSLPALGTPPVVVNALLQVLEFGREFYVDGLPLEETSLFYYEEQDFLLRTSSCGSAAKLGWSSAACCVPRRRRARPLWTS